MDILSLIQSLMGAQAPAAAPPPSGIDPELAKALQMILKLLQTQMASQGPAQQQANSLIPQQTIPQVQVPNVASQLGSIYGQKGNMYGQLAGMARDISSSNLPKIGPFGRGA